MNDSDDIYQSLQSLAETAFPKRCRSCGRLYHDAAAFIAETKLLNKKQRSSEPTAEGDSAMSVELFRNCPCGSTLTDVFNNRRDISENGIKRRNNFDALMTMIQKQHDISQDTARAELLKIMSGDTSDIIKNILPTNHPDK